MESLGIDLIDQNLRYNKGYLTKNDQLLKDEIFFESNGFLIRSRLADTSNCFNLNSLLISAENNKLPNDRSISVLSNMLLFLNYEDRQIDTLIDQIIDWVDYDDQPRSNGYEDYFYTGPINEPRQYTSKRTLFDFSELNNLPASREFDLNELKKYICVIPYSEKTNINVNTLELEDALVLASYLGISIDDAEYLIMNNPVDGFKTIEEFKEVFTNYLPDKSMNNFSTNTESFYLMSDTIYENYTFKTKSLITIEKGRATITTRTYNN
jgi:type II secretory pathway component PulK